MNDLIIKFGVVLIIISVFLFMDKQKLKKELTEVRE